MLKDGIAKLFINPNAHLLKLLHALLANLSKNAQIVFALLHEDAVAQLDKLVSSHTTKNELIAKSSKMMLACVILEQIVLVLAQSALSALFFKRVQV